MPLFKIRKYTKRKKAYAPKRKFKRLGRHRKMTTSMTVNIPKSLKLPIPLRFSTKLFSEMQGIYATGMSIPYQAEVSMNQCQTPFASTNFNLFPYPLQNSGTLSPIGMGQLLSHTGSNFGLYDNYRVNASKIELEFTPVSNADMIQVTLWPQRTIAGVSTATPTPAALVEQPYSKSLVLNSAKVCRLKSYMKIRTLYGLTKAQYSASNSYLSASGIASQFIGSRNAAPANTCYWDVVFQSAQGVMTTTIPCSYTVKVWYWVEFFNPTSSNAPNAT